jgi:hypothetical protein
VPLEGGDCAVGDLERHAHCLRIAREQITKRKRYAEHPLAHRYLWQHLVDQERRTFGHAPRAAARTEAAPFAAEGDEFLGMTSIAADAQKPMLQPPTLQAILELTLYVPRQIATRGTQRLEKYRIMTLDELAARCQMNRKGCRVHEQLRKDLGDLYLFQNYHFDTRRDNTQCRLR